MLKYEILEETEEGLLRTNLTERLVILSYLSYQLTEKPDLPFEDHVKADIRFIDYLGNCELFNSKNGMYCVIDEKKKHLYFVFKGRKKYIDGNFNKY